MTRSLGIAIPSFNDEATIRQTLESLANQHTKPNAVYVIDDASSDLTLSIAREFESALPVSIHGFKTNLGLVGNWNRCIELAGEDFLWILHSDDWLHPSAVNFALELIESDRCDIFSTGAVMLPSPEAHAAVKWAEKSPESAWSQTCVGASGFLQSLRFICSSVVVRRRLYDQFGRFSSEFPYSPDEELWPRLARHARLATFLGGQLTAVRTSGEHEMHRTWLQPDFNDRWNSLHRHLEQMTVGLAGAEDLDVVAQIERKRCAGLEWILHQSRKEEDEGLTLLARIRRVASRVTRGGRV